MTRPLPRALRQCPYEIPRVLSVATAHEWGMTSSAIAHAVAARGWQRLTRGMLLTVAGPPTRADWINAGLEIAGPSAAISGWDAVRIVGLGEPQPPTDRVLILCKGGGFRVVGRVHIRPTHRAFTSWTLPADHPELAFAPVVHTARAVADTGLLYRRLAPVRALVTSAVQQQRCEIADLIAEVDAAPRNYSAMLRAAVQDVRDGARSIAEAEAIQVLRRSPVPNFEANVAIVTVRGVQIAVVDLLWRELRAVIEIDSRQYHFSERDWNATRRRHNTITRYGLAVAHYSPNEVRRGEATWAKQVEVWLRARARELGVPFVVPRRRTTAAGPTQPFVVADLPR